jgi:4-hydroxy-tetrahydrodipicolinate reductase
MSGAAVPIIIAGAGGRMGRMLLALAASDPALRVAGALEAEGHPDLGKDAGLLAGGRASGVVLTDSLERCAVAGAVLIEFTVPEASLTHLRSAAGLGLSVVLGTTGFTAAEQNEVTRHAERVACLQAPNMSVGVTVLEKVVEEVSRLVGAPFDVEVVEMHHRMKKDAPSGTALALARAAARGRDADLESRAIYGRQGITGERPGEQIGVMSLRGGDVVGDHTVVFAGTGERIELTHRAQSREAFAAGALRGARWLAGRPPGLYGMREVMGLG